MSESKSPNPDRAFMLELTNPFSRLYEPYEPFAFGDWDVATNGAAMLLVKGASFPVKADSPPIGQFIERQFEFKRSCQFAALRQWATAAGPLEHLCDYCGSPDDESRMCGGVLGEIAINRCLLGKYLRPLSADLVEVCWTDGFSPILIRASDWQLFLMPIVDPKTRVFDFDSVVDADGA